jgi:hypothetical protein
MYCAADNARQRIIPQSAKLISNACNMRAPQLAVTTHQSVTRSYCEQLIVFKRKQPQSASHSQPKA